MKIGECNFNYLFFNDRKILNKKYKEWLNKDIIKLEDNSFNMINFLMLNGLINIKKAKDFIQ